MTEDDLDVIVDDLLDVTPFENIEYCLIFGNDDWKLLSEIFMAGKKRLKVCIVKYDRIIIYNIKWNGKIN